MTEAIAFDTYRFVKRLTEGGFSEEQAETLADEHVALLNANLATKADVARIEAAVKTDIAGIEAAVKADIARLEAAVKTEIARLEAGVETLRYETKADIARVEGAVKNEITRLDAVVKTEISRMEGRIEAVKADLLKWLFGALIAQGGLIVALVKLL